MSDYDKLKALLTEFGVGFTETVEGDAPINVIECREGGAKIDGYTGFRTRFYFDASGKFIEMGAWE